MTEGTRSNLWGAMRTAIETIRPQYAVIENVRGLLSATAQSDSDLEQQPGFMGNGSALNLRALGRVLGDLADIGYDAQWHGLRAADIGAPHNRFRVFIIATDTETTAYPESSEWRKQESYGLASPPRSASELGERSSGDAATNWGPYQPAIRRWERVLGRTAPAPTELSATGRPLLSPVFVEWMMGLDEGCVTGVPDVSRANQLKMCGNGVVPQQAYEALRRMREAG